MKSLKKIKNSKRNKLHSKKTKKVKKVRNVKKGKQTMRGGMVAGSGWTEAIAAVKSGIQKEKEVIAAAGKEARNAAIKEARNAAIKEARARTEAKMLEQLEHRTKIRLGKRKGI